MNCLRRSSQVHSGLAVVTMTPSRARASTVIGYSSVLGLKMAQTSPLRIPSFASDEATRSIPVVVCTSSVLGAADRERLARAAAVLSKASLSREQVHSALGAALRRGDKRP